MSDVANAPRSNRPNQGLHAQSSNLVAGALLGQNRYTAVYAVYRWLESYEAPITVTNDALAQELGISERFVRHCLKVFEKLALVEAAYARSGDKATRVLHLAWAFNPWTVRTLKQIRSGDVALDLARELVVHERGMLIDCAAKTWTPDAPPSGTPSAEGRERGTIGGVCQLTDTAHSSEALDHRTASVEDCTEKELPREKRRLSRVEKEAEAWSKLEEATRESVMRVIQHWRTNFGYAHAKPHMGGRRGTVMNRYREGYTEAQLLAALNVAEKDAWLRGNNPQRTPYDDIASVLGNAKKVDKLLQRAKLGLVGGTGHIDRTRSDLSVSDRPVEEDRF